MPELEDVFCGLLVGTAVGDALGLPAEGLSPRRIKRLWGGELHHRFLWKRGMVSDDTEHTVMVCGALLAHPDDAEAFAQTLARKLKLWLLAMPAGVGWATLRSILKLWCGVSPQRSGVVSAGNGPAMRSAVLGAFFADDSAKMEAFVRASTRLTHSDPRAQTGALAISALTAWAVRDHTQAPPNCDQLSDLLRPLGGPEDKEWQRIVDTLVDSQTKTLTVAQFANRLGLSRTGISGYMYHTVPAAIYAWVRNYGDFRATVESVIACGGDTDTSGAIAGALSGAVVGVDGIPREWVAGLTDWPISIRLLKRAAEQLAERKAGNKVLEPIRYLQPLLIPRNLLFLGAVLAHGFRRLLPPY
ncbi:MAG: ADP-ribosylglycohydrolase family protein [Thermodesulfobacteriota bacterium]